MATTSNYDEEFLNSLELKKDFLIIKYFSLTFLCLLVIGSAMALLYSVFYVNSIPIHQFQTEFRIEVVRYAVYFLVAMYGIFGAIRENVTVVLVYGLAVAIAGTIFVIMHKIEVIPINKYELVNITDKIWHKREASNSEMYRIQKNLKCCGREGPSDYSYEHKKIDNSCYDENNRLSKTGCFKAMLEILVQTNRGRYITLTWFILLMQTVSIIMSLVYIGVILERDYPDDE